LPAATPEQQLAQQIATGFHRCTTVNVEAGTDEEENRVNQVLDRVNVTGTVWLGTTLECCQCHNHKFDPFTHRDYYQFLAFYTGTPKETFSETKGRAAPDVGGPGARLPGDAEKAKQRDQIAARRQQVAKELEECEATEAAGLIAWEEKIKADAAQLAKLP